MEDSHLRNAVLWAYRKWQDEQGARLNAEEIHGYTCRQWYLILKAVYDQRIENQQKEIEKSIQRLHQVVEAKSTVVNSQRRYSESIAISWCDEP